MTLEIIIFVAAILFGIIWYWRESRSNKVYRFFNRMMHSKELQMKPENMKGFVHKQVFLMRLVWVTLVFVLAGALVAFATPINAFFIQYFVSAIVGTIIGTYVASLFIATTQGLKKENIEKNIGEAYQKGKDFVQDLTDGDEEESAEPEPADEPKKEEPPKKSARDRFKDKGMIK